MKISAYPGLRKATIEIAYDNGMINRFQTEDDYLLKLDSVLTGYVPDDLVNWSAWLDQRSEEHLNIICCGEQTEMLALMSQAPTATFSDRCLNDLLNEMFEA